MSSLEDLPAELRDQILMEAPDLPTLRSLVHASPVMHAQYQVNRSNILRACLDRELDGVFVDAYACALSRSYARDPRQDWPPLFRLHQHPIAYFTGEYRAWLSGSTPSLSECFNVHAIDLGCLRRMAAFHRSVVRPLAGLYSKSALANLAQATSSPPAGDTAIILNASGQIRLFRTIYRYETYLATCFAASRAAGGA